MMEVAWERAQSIERDRCPTSGCDRRDSRKLLAWLRVGGNIYCNDPWHTQPTESEE